MRNAIYVSSVRPAGEFGAVVEQTGDTTFLYPVEVAGAGEVSILTAIRIREIHRWTDLAIEWSEDQSIVAAVVDDVVTGAFDCEGRVAYGDADLSHAADISPLSTLPIERRCFATRGASSDINNFGRGTH